MSTVKLEASVGELRQRRAELAALNRLAYVAGTAPDLQTLFREGGAEVLQAFEADALQVYLLAEGDGRLLPIHAHGVTPDELRLYSCIPLRYTLSYAVSQDGIPRSWRLEDYPTPAHAVILRGSLHAAAAAPLQSRSRIIGCLNLGFRRERVLTADQLQMLAAMAAHFAAAIEAHHLLTQQRAISEANAQLYEELRTSAAELARTQAQLMQREHLASMGELAAVLAHEIRNPLGVLSNLVAAMRQRTAQLAGTGVLLDTMDQELERMSRLAEDLLDFARPRAPSLQPEPVEALLAEVARAAQAEAVPGQVALDLQVDPALPPVPMDARLMRRALLNVVINGIQAMRAQGRVRLRASLEAERACIEVHDEGPGIPGEVRARLFEPFFTTKPTGTGLGLAVVKRIVEQHRGHIDVESEPGRGTTFRIALPLGPSVPQA